MPLTIKTIEAAQPGEKPRRLFDGGGLYLELRPTGSRLWMFRYKVGGKEKRIGLGIYPGVSLREARQRADDARRLLQAGADPSAERQAKRTAAVSGEGTFEAVAREWFGRWRATKAQAHHARVLRALERDVFPRLGSRPIAQLEPVDVLPILRMVEERGAVETAHRIKQVLGMIFRYGVATGRCGRDPTQDLRGALGPAVETHHAAVTRPEEFGALLRAVDGYRGQALTGLALRLAPLVAVRPGELRHAEWVEVDLEEGTWTIPATKMKLRRDHVVPLASQAVELLREAQAISGRRSRYVFPSLRTAARPMSENTVNAALRRLGYEKDQATGHGFRASFRTIGAEVLGFRAELLEHQLAHAVRDPLGRAYNRAEFLPERREMMQRWADWCDEARGLTVSAPRPSGATRPPRSASSARA